MPSRSNSRRPAGGPPPPGGVPDLSLDTGDQFALDLADADDLTLADDGLRLIGDDAPSPDEDDGPIRPDVVERMAAEEVSEILEGFRARERTEQQRFEDATDSEYWIALCFQTREQKEQFLHEMGWFELGDKFIDGMLAAERAGVTLTARIPSMPRHNVDRQLSDLVE